MTHYPLAASTFDDAERRAIQEVVTSDRFTMGPKVAAFERSFADYFGVRNAIMVNSGSSANLIGIASLCFRKEGQLRRGDEVIVPCVSWSTTYAPLQQYGFKLVFVDIDPHTLNYDMDALEDAITPQTKMIVAVSILGNPCEYDRLTALCERHSIVLFEDNCESMGAVFDGRFTGTFGVLGTFSSFFSHHISTMEGGMIVTDDYELACLCRSLRNHGWTRDQPDDSPIFTKQTGDVYEAYRFILPGYNVRPTEISGALGLVQLKKFPEFLNVRRQNAVHFLNRFADIGQLHVQKTHPKAESSWFSFTLVLDENCPIPRDKVFRSLKEAGIEHRIITGGNFLRHDAVKYFDHRVHSRKNADWIHDNGFFVGNHPYDLSECIDSLYLAIKKAL